MLLPREATLLRIFIGETARFEGHPLYEAIVLKARAAQSLPPYGLRGL